MYTRVVETISKQGRARELCHAIDEKVLPILRKQAGFVDEVVMVSDTEANHVLAVSFWKTRRDAERYEREQFDNARKAIQQMFESTPVIRTYDVHTSTAHRFNAEKVEKVA